MLLTEWKFDVELEVAKEEAETKGIEKGILEGKKETARSMKAEGMDRKTIARITGLTDGEILKL